MRKKAGARRNCLYQPIQCGTLRQLSRGLWPTGHHCSYDRTDLSVARGGCEDRRNVARTPPELFGPSLYGGNTEGWGTLCQQPEGLRCLIGHASCCGVSVSGGQAFKTDQVAGADGSQEGSHRVVR